VVTSGVVTSEVVTSEVVTSGVVSSEVVAVSPGSGVVMSPVVDMSVSVCSRGIKFTDTLHEPKAKMHIIIKRMHKILFISLLL